MIITSCVRLEAHISISAQRLSVFINPSVRFRDVGEYAGTKSGVNVR